MKVRVKASPWQIDWGTLIGRKRSFYSLKEMIFPITKHIIYPNPTSNEMYFLQAVRAKYTLSDSQVRYRCMQLWIESLDLSHLYLGITLSRWEIKVKS
jgi:hypothetical protein